MAESSTNAVENNSAKSTPLHKPLHYTKSHPQFRSMDYLVVKIQEEDGRRSRSNSAPLSLEAIKVDHGLRAASDNFYAAKRMAKRVRRRTLGSFMQESIEKEMMQATLAEEEEEEEQNITPLLGTPV